SSAVYRPPARRPISADSSRQKPTSGAGLSARPASSRIERGPPNVGSPGRTLCRSRLRARRREQVAAPGRAFEIDDGAERIAEVGEHVLGVKVLAEDRLARTEVREHLEDQVFLEIVALAVRDAAEHAVEE